MRTFHIGNRKIWLRGLQVLLCVGVLLWTAQALFIHHLSPLACYRDYSYRTGTEGLTPVGEDVRVLTQSFQSKGDRLNHLRLYFNQAPEAELTLTLLSEDGRTVAEQKIACGEYAPETWNTIAGFSTKGLKRNGTYTLRISSESGLSMLSVCGGNTDGRILTGTQNDVPQEAKLAMGIDCTYTYATLGRAAVFGFRVLSSLLLAAGLCWCILRFEKMLAVFRSTEKRAGCILPAVYFAVSTVLIFNPLDALRNENVQFKRVLGEGLMENVDASRRTSNFFLWFIVFAAAFGLFGLLINYIRQTKEHPEARGMIHFLDHFMVVAFCTTVLHCITYFQDEEAGASVFYFTHSAVLLIALISMAYLCAGLYRKISVSDYAKVHLSLAALSLPIAVILPAEWEQGRSVFGIWCLLALAAIIWMAVTGKRRIGSKTSAVLSWAAAALSFLPFLTSAFIEGIHILNQHNAFVAHPARYYPLAAGLFLVFAAGLSILGARKKGDLKNWKRIAYPALIIGVSCLSVQIALVNYYEVDLFEGANAGILISDFLHFGAIPNIERYGGHMMTDVWEGLIYALLNGDDAMAYVSPYAGMLTPLLIVLFYWFVKEIWDEDAALYAALFIPYIDYWSYFGQGIMICLAAVAFVRKNTWPRAIALWGAFVWCTLYRLDMGFAFGAAAVITLIIWTVHTKRTKALQKVLLSLAGWAVLAGGVWCVVCLAKGINPVDRLLEFIMIGLSNQNWAYAGIGDAGKTIFSWFYLFLPMTVAGCLLYTTFSKSLREQAGEGRWILLLMLGWSYFANFSRGLVRHSLAESVSLYVTWTATWTGYLFLALFLASVRRNAKFFLPAFVILMLVNTQFLQPENFAGTSVAEEAMRTPESIIESWTPDRFAEEDHRTETYWERIARAGIKEQRVNLPTKLTAYAEKYRGVLDALLSPGETFADFINKPLLYCMLEREDPAYTSQSPLQLSGEFTQEQFIKEIKDVPIVLMPMRDFRASVTLDSLSNAYRYYLVSEYIYREFEPLCRYGDEYAIWVRKERAEEYKEKLTAAFPETEYIDAFGSTAGLECHNLTLTAAGDGSVELAAAGENPSVTGLQKFIDLTGQAGGDLKIMISFETDTAGTMRVCYDPGYGYDGDNVETAEIAGEGEAEFIIPVTEGTGIRLEIPEGSRVTIRSLRTGGAAELIYYGYDSPIGLHHRHDLGHLPREWAENEKKHTANDQQQIPCELQDGYYCFDSMEVDGSGGSYLTMKAVYDGEDSDGYYEDNDEYGTATVVFGTWDGETFWDRYLYTFTVREGEHDYLIRCSTDYYWYLGDVNAVRLSCNRRLHHVSMGILEAE